MKTVLTIIISNIIASIVLLPSARAFYEPDTLTVSPTLGINVFDKTANAQDSPTLGARGDYCLTSGEAGNFCLEGFANMTRLKSTVDNSSAFAFMLRGGPLFAFRRAGNLTPLLSAGVGGMYTGSTSR